MERKAWQDWVNLALGIWLFLSPWLGLAETQSAAWNAWIFGVVVAALAIAALSIPQKWEEWTNAVVGLWLIIAPFALGFSAEAAAVWNHVIVGVVVAADALWAGLALRRRTAAPA